MQFNSPKPTVLTCVRPVDPIVWQSADGTEEQRKQRTEQLHGGADVCDTSPNFALQI